VITPQLFNRAIAAVSSMASSFNRFELETGLYSFAQ